MHSLHSRYPYHFGAAYTHPFHTLKAEEKSADEEEPPQEEEDKAELATIPFGYSALAAHPFHYAYSYPFAAHHVIAKRDADSHRHGYYR